MRGRVVVALAAVGLVASGVVGGVAIAADDPATASCTPDPKVQDAESGSRITVVCTVPKPAAVTETVEVPGPTATATVTVTASPEPTEAPTSAAPSSSPPPVDPTTPAATPTSEPPATEPPPADFPGPSNTGVPAGVKLTAYTGSCTIKTAGTVIDAKTVTCPNLSVNAANVTIRNSKVIGHILVDTDVNRAWSLTLTDSEVDAGAGDLSAISNGNVNIVRTNIHGGHNGLECQEHSSRCAIRDSWIHDQWQPTSGDAHLGGLLHLGTVVPCTGADINGTPACAEIIHNTIVCDSKVTPQGGGCTGDINLLPHFGPLKGAIVRDNYLGANAGSAYCTYGGSNSNGATNVAYTGNVFERGSNGKCANFGPVTSFDTGAVGNTWANNKWSDGTPVTPAN